MNSLTSAEELAPWFERTERLLEQHEGDGVLSYLAFEDEEEFPVPEELQALGIMRIDVYPDDDKVAYVWQGGMGRTLLEVSRQKAEEFEVMADYDKYTSKRIWPPEADN